MFSIALLKIYVHCLHFKSKPTHKWIKYLKYLCIDYGLVRSGLAISDGLGRMAFPRCTVQCPPQSKRADFFVKLLAVIEEENPAALVIGLPLHLDGKESETTRQVRNFVARLQRRSTLPVYLMPEALSSEEAKLDLLESNLHTKKHKNVLDQQAAVRILQSFLALTTEQKEKLLI